MNTLFIYDTKGTIIMQMSGSVSEPVGVPFLWVDVPSGSRVISIDTSVTPNIPVYEDIQKTEVQILQEKITELENKILANDESNLMVLEAMADVYESVLPFLPM